MSTCFQVLTWQCFLLSSAPSPPTDVEAVQTTLSGPTEISWSPPVDDGVIVTGYRIYYTLGGERMNISVVAGETQHSLDLDGALPDGGELYINTESANLPSHLMNVTVDCKYVIVSKLCKPHARMHIKFMGYINCIFISMTEVYTCIYNA